VTLRPVVRELEQAEWATAAGVAARAFFDEEFIVGMLGAEPFARFVAVQHFYAVEPWDDDAVHLGAFLGTTMVGLIRASPYGRCFVCRHVSPTAPPSDPILAKDWVFEVEVLRAHAAYADHAWISRVAVEPALHGTGIGKQLIDAALERIGGDGPGSVLLECLSSRERFYAGRGFRRVAEVVDPHAEMSYLMLADLPAPDSA
jgi:GNAT superfamily N-acetyltransferase